MQVPEELIFHSHEGYLPASWKILHAKEICTRITDGTHDTPIPTEEGIPYVTAINIKNGAINFDSCQYLPEGVHQEIYKRCNPERGDLLVVNIGAGVGDCAYVDVDFQFSLKNVALLKPNKKLITSLYLFHHHQYKKDRIAYLVKAGGAQPFLSLKELRELKFVVPPIVEQQKIAQILSTWDKAIEKLEALIAAKQKRKKALMQQLLTAKKRFAGFDCEWKKWVLSDLGDTFNGLTGKNKDDFGFGMPFIPYMNIFKNNRIDINQFEFVDVGECESQVKVQYGDIFFTVSSETPDEVGMSSVLLNQVEEVYLNSFCFGFRLNNFKTLIPEFARYLFRAKHIRKQISVLAQGATRYNLSKGQMLKISIELPRIEEQQKIASVLSAADTEIETHQKQLAALKQQKKGLMQQLLTGKKRVKVDSHV